MVRCGHPADLDWRVLLGKVVYKYDDYNDLELFYISATATGKVIFTDFKDYANDDYLNFDFYIGGKDALYIEIYVCKRRGSYGCGSKVGRLA